MKKRVFSAILAILVFIPFIIFGGGYFAFAMSFLGMLALYEIAEMKGIPFFNVIGLVATICLLSILIPDHYIDSFTQYVNNEYLFYMTCLILLILTVFKSDVFHFEDAATLVMAAVYIGYGFHFLIVIRDLGIDTLMYQFLVIWSTDSGAYLFGKKFGKHKLSPTISPNKTIEGLLGGVLLATIIGGIYSIIIKPNLGAINNVWLLTIALSLFGQLGDLVESAMKRHFKVKDSGRFLPGHGGVLDRFDSSIFTSFMFMIWMNLFR